MAMNVKIIVLWDMTPQLVNTSIMLHRNLLILSLKLKNESSKER
jgi:hypothetical protein